jgi:hypothetical protein
LAIFKRHGLVEDSKTVAPHFETLNCLGDETMQKTQMRAFRVRGHLHAVTLLCAFILLSAFVLMRAAVPFGTAAAAADDDPPAKPSNAKPSQIRDEQGTLPKSDELPVPEAEELLRAKPFDWINLKTKEVLVVEPVAMRPDLMSRLPIRHDMAVQSFNHTQKYKAYKEAELASLRQFFKGAGRAEEFDEREAQLKRDLDSRRERAEALRPATYKLPITLQDGSVDPEYVLDLRFVDSIVYFEDLVLRRALQLIEEGRTPLAYDLLLLVARRHRDNNVVIQSELESEEKSLVARIAALDEERKSLRQSRTELTSPQNRNSQPAKSRVAGIEKTLVGIGNEIKDLESELRVLQYKLRIVRPKEFPVPDPPRQDDLLLPTWPGFDGVLQRLVYKDSDRQLEQGNLEEALRLLDELWKPGREVPGLAARLGRVVDRLIAAAIEREDYRRARHFLGYLATRDPAGGTVKKWRDDLAGKAAVVLQAARSASAQGDAASATETVELAARIWPEAQGLKDAHRELTERYQILRVAVPHLAGEPVRSGVSSEADERVRWLTEARLFEPSGISEQGVRYRSSFFESWEPTDLGRQVQFQLKLKRADWEARAIVTSADVFAELLSRTNPDSPDFDERLAGFVDGITVQSPMDFTVYFRQLPLRPEALWQMTVAVGDATRSLNDDAAGGDSAVLGRERFHLHSNEGGLATYRRVRAQPAATRLRRVDEVVEIQYESWDRALQALLRGEVSVVPSAGLRDLKQLQDDGRFFVMPHAIPRSHFLLFNPRQRALLDGQFRRALLHGIPRERLLNGVVLRDVTGPHARLVTGPFASNSYGYNRQLPQADYDPPLAATLALTAKKQLGGELPVLRMVCPDDPPLREIAAAMIEEWRRVGIEVRLLGGTDAGSDSGSDSDWDICYRTAKSVEPLTEIWPLLTMQPSARVDALQSLSEPTRRLLLELERTVDWTTATKLLHRLLVDLLIEARYIPLWEVDEYLVARKNVNGIPTRPIHAYDDIERWTVQSWYPVETP